MTEPLYDPHQIDDLQDDVLGLAQEALDRTNLINYFYGELEKVQSGHHTHPGPTCPCTQIQAEIAILRSQIPVAAQHSTRLVQLLEKIHPSTSKEQ